MKITGVVSNVSLEAGEALSTLRVKVAGELQPVILNFPKSLAKQLNVGPDDEVTLTVEATPKS